MSGPVEFVLDVAPFMVWQSNEGGTVIYANQGWISYTGLSLPLSSEWHSSVHPEDVETAIQAWKKCFASKEESSLAYRIRNTKGGYKWHQVTHHYDPKHNCVWWIGLGTDIPLSNSVNIPVREVEEMYWRVVEAAVYPIITVDAEGVVFTFNQAAQEMFMYSPVDILGKPFAEIIDIHGAIADATSTTVQVSAKKRDGTYIPVSLSVGQFQQFGRQLYVLVFHEAEGEIRLQQELHKSKDSFLRNMSHELRTPLFGLLGTMAVMQVPEDPTLQAELKRMEECTWHLLSVVNNMIDFYKLENLYISPVPQSFDPRALIADLCSAHAICVNPGVALSYEVAQDVPCAVVADANFLKHAVTNVLSNAVRFTQEGSVQALVTVESLEEGKLMLHFIIADTGIGISYEFYPKMFQPFMQMDASDTRQYGGVGLGLAVSKHLINLMGGTITFTSEVGKGSEFIVSVPVELPKNNMSNSVDDEVPFANTTPTSSNSGSASISPTSSISGSPPPSPPHTPTSCSPTVKVMRPNSLLSPISFAHMMPNNNGDHSRSPASPVARVSTALSPVIPHSPPSSFAPGSPIPPAPSPPSLFSDSPFCSPSGSPGGSPPSSPTGKFPDLRLVHSFSPIANIQPETSPPNSNIFHPFTPCPPFLLDAHGKPLLSHLCPSDRPCPRCAFVRPGAMAQTSAPSQPASAAPHSDPVSPRRTFAAAHRVTSRFVSPAQYASPVIQHSSSSPQFGAPLLSHIRSPSEPSAAIIAQLNLSSSLRPSLSSPALPTTRTRLCDSCTSILHDDLLCAISEAKQERAPLGSRNSAPCVLNYPELLSTSTTPHTVLDASPRTIPAAPIEPIFDDVIICLPPNPATSPTQGSSPRPLKETQELIPILAPFSPPPSPLLSSPPLSPSPPNARIDLPTSPTLSCTPSFLYTPPPAYTQKPRIPLLQLSRSASSVNASLTATSSASSSPKSSSTTTSYTPSLPTTSSSSGPLPTTVCSTSSPSPTSPSSTSPSSTSPSSASPSSNSPSTTPYLVPRLPLPVQRSTESSPVMNSVLLSPPSFLRKLDELFNAVPSSSSSPSSAPTTPTKHTPPTTPSRGRASSISTPKTPKTPRTPRSPAKSPHTPLAFLANLISPQQAASPAARPGSIIRSASFSASPPSPVPAPHVLSTSDNSPSFYAPLVSAHTPSLSTKAAQALSRVISLPSLSKSHSHIRPQSPSSSSSGSNSPLSPVLSFVPVTRTSSSPTLPSLYPPGFISSSPTSPSSLFALGSSPPSSPNKSRLFGIIPESPIPVSPRYLHSSLGTLLIPSPASSLPLPPDPGRKLYVSGPIDIAASHMSSSYSSSTFSPSSSPLMSPLMSPTTSPLISPCFSPQLYARENPTEISPSSYSSSPNPFLSSTPIPNSPMSLSSSPTSISPSPSSSPCSLSGSPPSLSSSPFASSSPPILSSSSPPSPTAPHTPDKTLPSGLRILVVEDNALNQSIIKKMLERVGWEVAVASNGREALDILFKEGTEKYVGYSNFNIILMDCQMPVLDGYQATRRIRKREKTRLGGAHMRIVAITASSHAEDERKCYEAGMDAFIAKPVSPPTLYSIIAQS